MLTRPPDLGQGGVLLGDTRVGGDSKTSEPDPPGSGSVALYPSPAGAYDRVTAYCPQAVKVMTTCMVAPPRVTAAVSVPESNRGATVQLAL